MMKKIILKGMAISVVLCVLFMMMPVSVFAADVANTLTVTSFPSTVKTETKTATNNDISGLISENTTWNAENGPYIIKGNIYVEFGVTLNIEEGAQIIFDGDYYLKIKGALIINGTKEKYVKISSVESNTGKIMLESNNNIINYCSMENLVWGIYLGDGSSNNTISNCNMRKNIFGIYFQYSNSNNLISNCIIGENMSSGLELGKSCSNNKIEECTIYNNKNNGLYFNFNSNSNLVRDCYFFGNKNGVECYTDGRGNSLMNNEIKSNEIGINFQHYGWSSRNEIYIINNNIYNNEQYDISSGHNDLVINAENNYWGTINSNEISLRIFDFYDDYDRTKVTFFPFLLEKVVMHNPPYICIINFDSQGGSVVASKTVNYNTTITVPTVPTRTGYTFGGWYTSSSYATPWIFASNLITTNTTIYAKWIQSTAAFITRFYQLCLSRDPDPTGLNDWVTKLQSGECTGANIAYNFVFSNEFMSRNLSNEDFTTIMYKAFFNRDPDPVGYAGWVESLRNGMSRYYVLAGFVNSQEFKNLAASYSINPGNLILTNPADRYPQTTAFVTRFYNFCLERTPDPGGLNDWVGQLQTRQRSGADVSYGFVFSKEFINRNLTNEDFVKIMYKAFFNRDPDPAGYNGWVSDLNAGKTRYKVLAGFVNSTEFSELCKVYGISSGILR